MNFQVIFMIEIVYQLRWEIICSTTYMWIPIGLPIAAQDQAGADYGGNEHKIRSTRWDSHFCFSVPLSL